MTATTAAPVPDERSLRSVLTVRDVATASGVAPSAVRFYERYGVITAVRTASNQRRFDDSAACRIKIAKLAQRVGLTVREIAEIFAELPADPRPADWGRIAEILISEAETRMANLRAQLSWMDSGTRLCEITGQIDENGRPVAAATVNPRGLTMARSDPSRCDQPPPAR